MNLGDRRPETGRSFGSMRRPRMGRSHPSGIRHPVSAFTLLEVLVALAIFALAAVVLGATYVNALNAYRRPPGATSTMRTCGSCGPRCSPNPIATRWRRADSWISAATSGRTGRRTWPRPARSIFSPSPGPARSPIPPACNRTRSPRPSLLLRPTWSDPVERGQLLQQAKDQILKLQGAAP